MRKLFLYLLYPYLFLVGWLILIYMSRKELWLLLLLAGVQFTNIMDFMVIMPLGPQLRDIFHISVKEFGLVVAAYNIAAGISGFAAAFYLDRFDRKQSLAVIYTGFIVGTVLCGLAPTYLTLVMARAITGIFGGVMSAVVLSIVGDAIPAERRGRGIGIVMASFSAAAAFGVPFGNFFAATFSWHFPFFFLAGLGGIILLLILRFIPTMRGHLTGNKRPNPMATLQGVFASRNQQLALLMMFCLMLGQFSVIPYISDYMVKFVGLRAKEDITLIYLLGGFATIFTAQIIGKLSDTFPRPKVFAVLAVLSLGAIAAVTNMPAVKLPWVLIGTTAFFIFISGRMIPATAIMTSAISPQQRGGFMSIMSSVQQLGSGLAVPLAGFLMGGDYTRYPIVGVFAMGMSMVGVFLIFRIRAAA